jgi:hypothetical protein
MRGSPVLRALIALGVLLALGWPLHRLLNAKEETTDPQVVKLEEKRGVQLQVSFTEPPDAMRVLSLGEVVWEVERPEVEVEKGLSLAFPREGVDLQFEIDWPADSSNAARAVLTDPEGREHTGFVWGSGKTTEVLTFQ